MPDVRNAENGVVKITMGKGELILTDVRVEKRVSFLDYVFGGCEIGVQVAIDYTLSNGAV